MSNVRYRIPIHPQPSIWETTIADGVDESGEECALTHRDIEEILARPRWNFADAEARVLKQMRKTHRQVALPGDGGGRVLIPKRTAQRGTIAECPTGTSPHRRHKITVGNGLQVECPGWK